MGPNCVQRVVCLRSLLTVEVDTHCGWPLKYSTAAHPLRPEYVAHQQGRGRAVRREADAHKRER